MPAIDQLEKNIFEWLSRWETVERVEWALGKNVAFGTSKGEHRQSNQDRVLFIEIAEHISTGSPLYAALVADGMGGMADGSAAASLAAATFCANLSLSPTSKGLKRLAVSAIHAANEAVFSRWNGRAGTTLTAVIWGLKGCVGIHAGDSRIYVDSGNALKVLTSDDTIAALAGQYKNEPASSEIHKHDNRLVQFVGVGDDLIPHVIDLNSHWEKAVNQWLMLSTDGAHFGPEESISNCFRDSHDPLSLTASILSMSRASGSDDNASLIVAPVHIDVSKIDLNGADLRISIPGQVFVAFSISKDPATTSGPKSTVMQEVPKRKAKIPNPRTATKRKASPKEVKPKRVRKTTAAELTPTLFEVSEQALLELIDKPSDK